PRRLRAQLPACPAPRAARRAPEAGPGLIRPRRSSDAPLVNGTVSPASRGARPPRTGRLVASILEAPWGAPRPREPLICRRPPPGRESQELAPFQVGYTWRLPRRLRALSLSRSR